MTWRLAGSLVELRHEFDEAHPNRPKQSDGTLGDTAHAARTSDHNPDADGIVRAWDCTAIDESKPHPLAEFLLAKRDPRTKYVISQGRMFASYSTSTRKAWTWGPYTGANGHFHHCHVSVVAGAAGDNPARWGYPLIPLKAGVLMALTNAQQLELLTKVRELHADYGKPGGVGGPMRELLKRTRDLVVLLAKKAGI